MPSKKNWSVVRKLLGYERYKSEAALVGLNAVYTLLWRWTNHWQPTLKLIGKERDGAKVTRRADRAQTPYRRVLAAGILAEVAQQRLEQEQAGMGPLALRRQLKEVVRAFGRCHVRAPLPFEQPPTLALAG